MLSNNIQIFYNSGTGNTYLIVKAMVEVFTNNQIEVKTYRIEKTDVSDINLDIPIGLAFPVAFQSTYKFVWDFFKRLPKSNGTPIFMVDTMQAFSGAIVGPLKKVLTEKGYDCIGANEIVMPSNLFNKNINKEKNEKIITKGIKNAKLYANQLIEGNTIWRRIPLLSDGLYKLCVNDFVLNIINKTYGKKITVDKEKCIKCELCVKLCPTKNIKMDEYPVWGENCQLCMRCLSYCPTEAVIIPNKTFKRYKAIESTLHLKDI
ncbi:MAG: EFR1 family ferrodoxin [Clostridiales bacterium]|nr:EFR1 family ferrodoxin [Clostridiales bacterium]